VMAASNRDLEQEVKERRFRQDLFYRLSVLPLTIPPLRRRVDDIPLFAERFLEHFGAAAGRHITSMNDDAMMAFVQHPWPGNVRELMNVVERAVLVSRGSSLSLEDLPEEFVGGTDGPQDVVPGPGPEEPEAVAADHEPAGTEPLETGAGSGGMEQAAGPVDVVLPAEPAPLANWMAAERHLVARPLRDVRRDAVEELERRYIHALLRVTGGRVGETARRAGIVPRSLYEKMRKYGLRKEDYR
jgi:DNA-binding NtrC family response regulator